MDELVKLYHATTSTSHQRWFLTALFSAQGQKELSVIRRDEINLTKQTITHRRNKTGQLGVYWIPSELVTMLRDHWKEQGDDPEGLAFRTREGSPLVDEAKNTDAVYQAWQDICGRAGLDWDERVTFYGLRRFMIDYATRHGGEWMGETAGAHTPKTMRANTTAASEISRRCRRSGCSCTMN